MLPELPTFGGKAHLLLHVYGTDATVWLYKLEDIQRLLKAFRNDLRETVKSLLKLLFDSQQCKCSDGAVAFQIWPTGTTNTQPAQQHPRCARNQGTQFGKACRVRHACELLQGLLAVNKGRAASLPVSGECPEEEATPSPSWIENAMGEATTRSDRQLDRVKWSK